MLVGDVYIRRARFAANSVPFLERYWIYSSAGNRLFSRLDKILIEHSGTKVAGPVLLAKRVDKSLSLQKNQSNREYSPRQLVDFFNEFQQFIRLGSASFVRIKRLDTRFHLFCDFTTTNSSVIIARRENVKGI